MLLRSLSFRLQGSEPRGTDRVFLCQLPLRAFLPEYLDNKGVMKHTPKEPSDIYSFSIKLENSLEPKCVTDAVILFFFFF